MAGRRCPTYSGLSIVYKPWISVVSTTEMPFKNPEDRKEYMRRYRQERAESESLRKAAWLQENKERQAERLRNWRRDKSKQDGSAALSALADII